jgi:hypothetical protein
VTTSCNRAVLRSTHRRKNATDSRPPVPCTSVLLHKDVDNNLQQFACALDMTTTRVLSPIHLCLLLPLVRPSILEHSGNAPARRASFPLPANPTIARHSLRRSLRSQKHTQARSRVSQPGGGQPLEPKKSPTMGSHKGREGQGARTAFRKAPQASPPETRFTVEVNDFLERFKLLELGLVKGGETPPACAPPLSGGRARRL